jgi:cytoskeleton protein RodZ
MKQTGEILKKAREEKGISISEVGLALKLSTKVLKAIEEGDEKNLPAKTFVRGFIKSYATYLRLDIDQVLEFFYQDYGSTKPRPYLKSTTSDDIADKSAIDDLKKPGSDRLTSKGMSDSKTNSAKNNQESVSTYNPLAPKKDTKTLALVIFSIFLVGLILFTKKMIDKYSKEAEIPKIIAVETPPETAGPHSEISKSDSPADPNNKQVGQISHDTTTKAQQSPVATVPSKQEIISEAPPLKQTPTSTSAAPSMTTTATASPIVQKKADSISPPPASMASTATATAASTTAVSEDKNKAIELIVEALDSVEVEYSTPTSKPQKIKLLPDQVHTFKSRNGLKIHLSNGGAVNIIKNGKDVGIPGDLGKPVNLVY